MCNKIVCEKALKSDFNILKKLFKEAFLDSDNYIDFYFDNVENIADIYVCRVCDKIVATMYTLKVTYNIKSNIYNGAYIYAVATFKNSRGNAYMTRLMNYVESVKKNSGYDFIVLVPQTKTLFTMYQKLGFVNFTYLKHMSIKRPNVQCKHSFIHIDIDEYFKHRNLFFKDENILKFSGEVEEYLIEEIEYTKNLALYSEKFNMSILYYVFKQDVYIREVLCDFLDYEKLESIYDFFRYFQNIYLKGSEKILPFQNIEPYSMLKTFKNIDFSNVYSNLMLD